MDKYNQEKLAQGNGKDGAPALVAVKDSVYDLSTSDKWINGKHMGRHQAGEDLTTDLKAAPHGMEVLEKFPPVYSYDAGTPEKPGPEDIAPWPLNVLFKKIPMLKRHPHPMTVHFPIAFLFAAFAFMIIFFITKNADLEMVSFYLMASATLTAPVAIITGFQSWWLYYGSTFKGKLMVKIILAPVTWILTASLTLWQFTDMTVISTGGTNAIIFFLIMLINITLLVVVATIGGQLTFPE